jgi:amidohydrolase
MNRFLFAATLLLAVASVVSPSALAAPSAHQLAEAELPSLLAVYQSCHAHPELSMQERWTSALLAKELRAAGCEVTEHVGKFNHNETAYGVVGVMKNGLGPVVLVRTDMDALPIKEETGLPFASVAVAKNEKGEEVHVMHACGHDVHVAALIGTARALAKTKDQWRGTVIFIGQQAEEIGSGAHALLEDGLYTRWPKPDFALGFHDDAALVAGHLGIIEGYAYANVDSVDVTVRGVGGHGAYPNKTKDPIVLSAEIINAWQTIASRENNPIDPLVITVGSIHGGTKHNIIPDEVKMQLTVRSYKEEVRQRALAAIERIAKGLAIAAGIPADRLPIVTIAEESTPATYNNPELSRRLAAVWTKAFGGENLEMVDPAMGAEDFSLYSLPGHTIPAVDVHVGAVDPVKFAASKLSGAAPLPTLHSSKFQPAPEPTIKLAMLAMTDAVLELLKK